jgi:hypothetical protein
MKSTLTAVVLFVFILLGKCNVPDEWKDRVVKGHLLYAAPEPRDELQVILLLPNVTVTDIYWQWIRCNSSKFGHYFHRRSVQWTQHR